MRKGILSQSVSLVALLPCLMLFSLVVSGGMGIVKGQWGTLKDIPLPSATTPAIGTDVNWQQFGCQPTPRDDVLPKREWLRAPDSTLVNANYDTAWRLSRQGYLVLAFCY